MDIRQLKRDPHAVKAILREMPDGRLVVLKDCKIQVPARYLECGLAEIGADKHILGIYALIVEGQVYSVSIVNAMVSLGPTTVSTVKVGGEEYLEFEFEKGSTLLKSTNLVRVDTLTYVIFDEFYQKGNVPWYIGYEDMGRLFDTAQKHANASVGRQRKVMQLIASLVGRDPSNPKKYYRTLVKSRQQLLETPPVFVPLMSVRYGATNTLTKLGGSYFRTKGVTSALISPAERSEKIETILRR